MGLEPHAPENRTEDDPHLVGAERRADAATRAATERRVLEWRVLPLEKPLGRESTCVAPHLGVMVEERGRDGDALAGRDAVPAKRDGTKRPARDDRNDRVHSERFVADGAEIGCLVERIAARLRSERPELGAQRFERSRRAVQIGRAPTRAPWSSCRGHQRSTSEAHR